MPEITLDGTDIDYDLRYSNRAKYSRIDVNLKGVTVVIPEGSDIDPEAFLYEKKDWVVKKYEKVVDYWARVPNRNFEDGEKFPYMGEDYKIKFSDNGSSSIEDGKILVSKDKAEKKGVEEIIEEIYRDRIREKVKEIISDFDDEIQDDFNKIYIRNQKTKWASCSSKKNLSFNWRLLMAPEEIIEYVVVHELVHLEEANHSDRFWFRLRQILPDYQRRRKWLKDNSPELVMSGEDLV